MQDAQNNRLDFSRDVGAVECLFCFTGREQAVANEVNQSNNVTAVVAAKWKKEWHQGGWRTERKVILPGYVFLYWHDVTPGVLEITTSRFLRVLKYSDGSTLLTGTDKAFADWLWTQNGTIGVSKARRCEGEKLAFSGPLAQFGGVITLIDRRKQIARITLDIAGGTNVWLSFDYDDAPFCDPQEDGGSSVCPGTD